MNERDDEDFQERPRLFAWDAADECSAALLQKLREARERVGPRDADISIHENEERMAREAGESVAGKVFSIPSGRQWQRGSEAHARVLVGDLANEGRGGIGRGVVGPMSSKSISLLPKTERIAAAMLPSSLRAGRAACARFAGRRERGVEREIVDASHDIARQKVVAVVVKPREMKLKAAAECVGAGVEETLSYLSYPREHWRKLRTKNSQWRGRSPTNKAP